MLDGENPPASLLVMGSGLWYLRNPTSGGLGAWTTAIHSTFDKLRQHQGQPVSPLVTPWDDMTSTHGSLIPGLLPDGSVKYSKDDDKPAKPVQEIGQRMEKRQKATKQDTDFSIADAIFFLPVPNPVEERLSHERAETIVRSDVEAMNADLYARLLHDKPPPVIIPSVYNEMLVDSETTDGIHWSDVIMNKQAELMFSWRCADAMRKGAQEGVCCRRYNTVRPLQGLLLLFFGIWAPATAYFCPRSSSSSILRRLVPSGAAAGAWATFGLAMVYLFLADRSTIFLKEQKDYDAKIFGGLTVAALITGLATFKSKGKDMGFLNRDMTDEWKGWMQSESGVK
jgi:hypothetical protein